MPYPGIRRLGLEMVASEGKFGSRDALTKEPPDWTGQFLFWRKPQQS